MPAPRTSPDSLSSWPWPFSCLHRSRGRPAAVGTVASPFPDQVAPLRR